MAMNSPLGKYAQIVAVVVVLSTIAAWGFAILSGNTGAANSLDIYAGLCFGAVLGSAATVNGWKRDQQAIQTRLDSLGAPPAKNDPT